MQQTPKSLRQKIGLFGKTNAGKSSFLNMISGQDTSIVSDIHGTTTDIVEKPMELLPLGPVLFLDTAGLNDSSDLGKKRSGRSKNAIKQVDVAVIITTAEDCETDLKTAEDCAKENIPIITVFNKSDLAMPSQEAVCKFEKFGKTITLSCIDKSQRQRNTEVFKETLQESLPKDFPSHTLFEGLIKAASHVIFVVPIDSGAPKGRLILPQVQALRDILDTNALVSLTQPNTYKEMLDKLKTKPDLVVCDSQVVDFVVENTPPDVKLTTFSIIFARNKGELQTFTDGGRKIATLTPADKILIAESCTHHPLGEDIGRVKIPNLLKRRLGFSPQIDFCAGKDFPQNLQDYSLIIHCGACMLSRREMLSRIETCKQSGIAITNYGVTISFLQGVGERVVEVFENKFN